MIYVYSRDRETEKLHRKGKASVKSTSAEPHSPASNFHPQLEDETKKDAISLKMKRLGQSALSTFFGKSSVEESDAGRQLNSKVLFETSSNRSMKRMPSLVNGVVVMAAIPNKAPENPLYSDRWSPCSESEADERNVINAELSDGGTISTGSRECENSVSEGSKVVNRNT